MQINKLNLIEIEIELYKSPRINYRFIVSRLEWGHFQRTAKMPLRNISKPRTVRTLSRAKGHT